MTERNAPSVGVWLGLLCTGILLGAGSGLIGCGQQADEKIPITTSSDEARASYVAGRELQDQLRGTDARRYFEDAVARDEEFALAHYSLALNATTNTEFFEELRKAVSLSYKVSDGERWMILGLEAGTRNQLATQREYYSKIVEAYPDDERAHALLGNYYFGQQDYESAIEYHKNAIDIDPDYSLSYNILGYSYRLINDLERAEQAFKKYIALIPEEPNPYDSYAEFLMRVGRFEESIENYRRALSINPDFVVSYVGIAHNQLFLGDPVAARAVLDEMQGQARNNAERRAANLWTAATYLYEGEFDRALAEIAENYAMAEEGNDLATMANDLNVTAGLLLEANRPVEAIERHKEGQALLERADVPIEVKEGGRRGLVFNECRAALKRSDFETAHAKLEEYRQRIAAQQLPNEIRQYHLLAGQVALAEEDYAGAVRSLSSADQRNSRVLYLTCLAYKGLGQLTEARSFCQQAADFNSIGMVYALIRPAAQAELERF